MPSRITKPQSEPLTFICSNSLYEVMNMTTELLTASGPALGTQTTWKRDVRKETVLDFEIRMNFVTILYPPHLRISYIVQKMLKYMAFCRLNSNRIWQHKSWNKVVLRLRAANPTIADSRYRIMTDAIMVLVDSQGHLVSGAYGSNSQSCKSLLNAV